MITLDLITIAIFTASWTAEMAAMMLPGIVPRVCYLYLYIYIYIILIIGITTGEKQKSISPS
jgi:hypothetical protein